MLIDIFQNISPFLENSFLTVDKEGFVFVTDLGIDDPTRIKFNYRDITSISYGSQRVLISASACSSLYDTQDWQKICDLNNRDGPVYKVSRKLDS